MNILIIDDSQDLRSLIRLYLSKELPEAVVEEYDPVKSGRPDNVNWSDFDVLLLDYMLGENEDGLEWLKTYKQAPGFPPAIVLTAEGDEYIAMKAVKLGAADYINKKDISPRRLKQIVEQALEFVNEEDDSDSEAARIVDKIQQDKEVDGLPESELDIGYKFVRQIGQGAMSRVYLAEKKSVRLSLVLKVLDLTLVQDRSLLTRFVQEAELISALKSPFVVKIHDHGMTESYGFIAMEFFSRGDLKQRMELGILPEVAFNYMTHITYGLEAIHSIGVVHRDLKPANIMFRGDDSLALADFGISKKLEGGADLTSFGQVLGTPHYMSPEQGEGKKVDTRSDLYSAGVLLYELLTGGKPFNAATPAAMIYQHVHAEIPKLPAALSQYQEIIDRILAKNPDDRYQRAREFIRVLEAAEQDFY